MHIDPPLSLSVMVLVFRLQSHSNQEAVIMPRNSWFTNRLYPTHHHYD